MRFPRRIERDAGELRAHVLRTGHRQELRHGAVGRDHPHVDLVRCQVLAHEHLPAREPVSWSTRSSGALREASPS